jgi:hypothetical protein
MKTLTLLIFVITSLHSFQVSAKGRTPLSSCSPTNETVDFITTSIRNYLSVNPTAADTVEGIHNWWINWPDLPESMSCTQTALVRLEHEGFVESREVGDRILWRKVSASTDL